MNLQLNLNRRQAGGLTDQLKSIQLSHQSGRTRSSLIIFTHPPAIPTLPENNPAGHCRYSIDKHPEIIDLPINLSSGTLAGRARRRHLHL